MIFTKKPMNINLLKCLPGEVLSHIITFSYNVQSKILLEDIKDFRESKLIMEMLYFNHFQVLYSNLNVTDYIDWFANDVLCFAYEGLATVNGYAAKFNSKLRRVLKYKSDTQFVKFIYKLSMSSTSRKQINTFWGIFTPDERIEFKNYAYNIYNFHNQTHS